MKKYTDKQKLDYFRKKIEELEKENIELIDLLDTQIIQMDLMNMRTSKILDEYKKKRVKD